ncbi:MAG: hypothetical protein PVG93_06005 [Phycisphaerales bacterium]|jgi:hypothetical protein
MREFVITTIAIVTVCSAVILVAGCEPEPTSSAKQERLYAAENIELKKQMADMEKRHQKELAQKQSLLDKCEEEKEGLKLQAEKEAIKLFQDELTNTLMEESQRLQDENKQLKAKIEELTK